MDHLKIYIRIDSTNKEAHRLLAAGPVLDDLTLVAEHQTDGRGQLGRIWIAEPGSHLAMTIIHQPHDLKVADLPLLSLKTSLGIVRALKSIDPAFNPMIKWPNDIYFLNKKLCGILIENSLSGERVQHSIIGIGMNVNETRFLDEIPNAISLHQCTGKVYEIKDIALNIRDHVIALLNEPSMDWKSEYDQLVFGKGKAFDFESNDVSFPAIVNGISIDGKLVLEMEDGKSQAFGTHEVKWVL